MDNIYKKVETELDSLTPEERKELLIKFRDGIDEIDQELVKLLSKRTLHSVLIGRIKRTLNLPTYNPEREKEISKKIASYTEEPLSEEAVMRIYERILDESRAIQREESERGKIFKISSDKMKLKFGNLLSKKEFLIIAGFFIALVLLFYFTFFTPNYYKGNGPVMLQVGRGEPFSKIAEDLYDKGVIPSKFNMRTAAFIYGASRKIKAARYYIPNGLSYIDLLDFLMHSKADYLRTVSILSGSSDQWIAAKLHYDLGLDSVSVYGLVEDKSFIDSLGINAQSLTGYLLPRKYDMYENSSPREDLTMMVNGFKKFMTDSLKKKAGKLGFSVRQILTMASIVDGETNNVEEMPKIAAVYYNRLKKGMPLQADPTIEYIKNKKWGRVRYNDLKIKSPYNTYLHPGLPPGPINNPGKEAIMAALYPADNNYLYFVADGSGGHIFSTDFSEHKRHVEKYRKWLNSLKRK